MKRALALLIPLGMALAATYMVQPGETLYRISRMYKVTVDELKKANGLETDLIRAGQVLVIPGAGSTPIPQANFFQQGAASWYGAKFQGRRTASGERFDMYALTAAHRTLRFGSLVRVTNLKNGKSVVVRINDRGPFHSNRIIDLSYQAATQIGALSLTTVGLEVLR